MSIPTRLLAPVLIFLMSLPAYATRFSCLVSFATVPEGEDGSVLYSLRPDGTDAVVLQVRNLSAGRFDP